jgi:hypothetical protein
MPLKLSHFVFSSLNGYRPVYVSPDLPAGLAPALEALAKGVYLTAQRTDLYLWLHPTDSADILAVKGFRNGTDRAGRSRSCVHIVVFSASDAAGAWFFSPLSLPERVFVTDESSLQAIANELVTEIDVPAPATARPPDGLPRGAVASILALMLNPKASALILDGRGDALTTLRSLVWAVPPPARRDITVAAWAAAPNVPGIGAARITILPPGSSLVKQLPKPDTVLEYPVGVARDACNGDDKDEDEDATFHVYAEFLASNLTTDRGCERVRKLAGLLERHPPTLELNQERYRHILTGFETIEHNVEAYGSVKIRNDVKASLASVKEFALAGMPSLSLDILDAVVSSAMDLYDIDAGAMQSALGKLKTNIEPGDRRFVEACGFLARQLEGVAEALGGLSG